MDLVALAQQFGPLLALIIYFVWRDGRREDAMQQVIAAKDQQITQQAGQLAEVLSTTVALATRCEDALRETRSAFDRNSDISQAMLTWLKENGSSGAHRALDHA